MHNQIAIATSFGKLQYTISISNISNQYKNSPIYFNVKFTSGYPSNIINRHIGILLPKVKAYLGKK